LAGSNANKIRPIFLQLRIVGGRLIEFAPFLAHMDSRQIGWASNRSPDDPAVSIACFLQHLVIFLDCGSQVSRAFGFHREVRDGADGCCGLLSEA